ncbi:MAG: bifunctional farnesyl-diphosphate farnesyltransferase/squalene synthase [Pleopsidium flavum]|nr:MAG: bifunctional farnesyl-diphosphate farnesyltransferase/squalene synthase [Pleopsidium flavum]
MKLTHLQIEQFIESIFPSQDPQAIVRQQAGEPEPVDAEKTKEMQEAKWDMFYMIAAVGGTLFLLSCVMIWVAYLMGARFDVAVDQIGKGKISRPQPSEAEEILRKYDHGEL